MDDDAQDAVERAQAADKCSVGEESDREFVDAVQHEHSYHDTYITVEELVVLVRKLRDEVDSLRKENEELRSRLDEKDAQGQKHESLLMSAFESRGSLNDLLDREFQTVHNRISNVQEEFDDRIDELGECNPRAEVDAYANRDDLTPIERTSLVGEDATSSASTKRAVSLFENFTDWATRTNKGYVLRSGKDNVRKLLSADRDERLAWKQVHRAYEALEDLSGGYIEYEEHDRHGKMLVLSKPMPTMAGYNGNAGSDQGKSALTASSAPT